MNPYNKLSVIAEVEDYFGYNEEELRDALCTLLTIWKDDIQYKIRNRRNELELCTIRNECSEIKEYPKSVYRLARLLTLLEYSESEGETSYFILNIFFNKDNDGEDVSFLTLCQDVADTVDWVSETYGYEIAGSNILELIGIFKRLHLEFSKLI